jgi:hypothetical protein
MQSLSAASLVDDQGIADAPLADLHIFHSTVDASDPTLYYAQFPDASLIVSPNPSQYPYSINDFTIVPVSQVDEQPQAISSGCRDLHSSYVLQQSHDAPLPSQEIDKILFSPCSQNSKETNAMPSSPLPQDLEGPVLQFDSEVCGAFILFFIHN